MPKATSQMRLEFFVQGQYLDSTCPLAVAVVIHHQTLDLSSRNSQPNRGRGKDFGAPPGAPYLQQAVGTTFSSVHLAWKTPKFQKLQRLNPRCGITFCGTSSFDGMKRHPSRNLRGGLVVMLRVHLHLRASKTYIPYFLS